MTPFLRRASLALLLPGLTGCAIGAYISPLSPLERQVNGTYEGVGKGPTGHVPYRLLLSLQPRGGKVSGVLTNLESRKAYALSGTFQQAGDQLTLDTALFEDGNKHRGNLRGVWQGGKLSANLRTVLLCQELMRYALELNRVAPTEGESLSKP